MAKAVGKEHTQESTAPIFTGGMAEPVYILARLATTDGSKFSVYSGDNIDK